MGRLRQFLWWLHARPVWRRTALIAEIVLADLLLTVLIMIGIFVVHACANLLAPNALAFGYTLSHIFSYFHVINVLVNSAFAVWHLINAHRSPHD